MIWISSGDKADKVFLAATSEIAALSTSVIQKQHSENLLGRVSTTELKTFVPWKVAIQEETGGTLLDTMLWNDNEETVGEQVNEKEMLEIEAKYRSASDKETL